MEKACVKLKTRYQAGGAVYSIGDSVILDAEEAQRITALGAGEMIPFPVSQTPLGTLLAAENDDSGDFKPAEGAENAPLVPLAAENGDFQPAEGSENAPLVPLAPEESPKAAARKTTKK